MNFVRIVNGAIVEGPSDLVANWIGPALEANKDGSRDNVRYVGLHEWPADQLALLGWYAVTDEAPAYDPAKQTLTRGGVALVAGVPTRQYAIAELPPPTPQPISHEQLVALLLQKGTLAKADIDATVVAAAVAAQPDAVKPIAAAAEATAEVAKP